MPVPCLLRLTTFIKEFYGDDDDNDVRYNGGRLAKNTPQ